MADNAKAEPSKSALKIVQGRSPAYPYISLREAVRRAEQVRDAGASRADMPPETFYKIWELGALSSGARQTMAALNHFGLVDYVGRGDVRKVKLSDLALRIVLDRQPNSADRAVALATAALNPSIHADLYEKYKTFLPADVVIHTYLTRDRGYNDQAAEAVIGEYKDTLAYAGIGEPGNMPESSDAAGDSGLGVVRVLSAEEIKPASSATAQSQQRVKAMEGERELTRGLLAKDASFRLIVSGSIGVKEIETLIKKLEIDKEILAETDESAS